MKRQTIIEMIGKGHKEKKIFGLRLKAHKDVLYIAELWKPKNISWRAYGGLLFIPPLFWILALCGGYKEVGKFEVSNSDSYKEMSPIKCSLNSSNKIVKVIKLTEKNGKTI